MIELLELKNTFGYRIKCINVCVCTQVEQQPHCESHHQAVHVLKQQYISSLLVNICSLCILIINYNHLPPCSLIRINQKIGQNSDN